MKTFKDYLDERCWSGYKPVPGKKAYSKGSCVQEDGMGAGAVGGGSAPTNTVGAIAGSGDSRLPAAQREPGVSKKRKSPVMMGLRRKPPKV